MIKLSVVIAAHNAERTLGECLTALLAQPEIDQAEIIVASGSTDGTNAMVRGSFPSVRLLELAPTLNLPELRGAAIAEARGEIIAILDPFSIVQAGWMAAIIAAHGRQATPVIGGPVGLFEAGSQGWAAWAIYINEYGMFLPPMPEGARTILAGSNVSYKRAALFDGDTPRYPEFWKTFVNWEIEQQGHPLWLTSDAVVLLHKPIPFGEFLASRFDHGRCFAGMRNERRIMKLVRAITSPLLPPLLLWRWSRQYWARRRYRGKLILTLPAQMLLFGWWSVGEMVGSLFGIGDSCRKLFY